MTHHSLKRIAKNILVLFCAVSVFALFSLSQKSTTDGQVLAPLQSTTGPTPPPGVDTKGHVFSGLQLQAATVISGVPAYIWHHGCGPTAVGMAVGYYDSHGYMYLIPGNASTQTAAVDTAIASTENYNDYCLPIDSYPTLLPDKSELPAGDEHADNCIADCMKTSQSYHSNYYGWSWNSHIKPSFENYIKLVSGYKGTSSIYAYSSFSWASLKSEIDNNRPLVFLVDTDADGTTDHFITVIGYNSDGGIDYYGCYNTWDGSVHWYEYRNMGSGISWGVATINTFAMSPIAKDDYVGTWDGQGVYYRNSETGKWIKLAAPANLVAAGDLGGDSIDDLITVFPSAAGVWTRSSSTGTWTKLSSTTAKHISSGDINGDNREDLLATWDGTGVFYRNSIGGAWTKIAQPANFLAAGDLDGDTKDDPIIIFPTPAGVWVKYSKTGTWAKLSSTSAKDIASGDMNGDGRDDLLATWDGSGVYYRNSISGAWVKMATPADQVTAGDVDGDGADDLITSSAPGVYVKSSKTGTWSRLADAAKDMATGLMRGGIWGSSAFGFMPLNRPLGGYAESPVFLSGYKDLSEEGPGGWRFAAQEDENLLPLETGEALSAPGPGDPGFTWDEQDNLFPQEQDKAVPEKRQKEGRKKRKRAR